MPVLGLQEMDRECTKLKDEAEASSAKAAHLSTDNTKLKQVCSDDGQGSRSWL